MAAAFDAFHMKLPVNSPRPKRSSVCSSCMLINKIQGGEEDFFFYKMGSRNNCSHKCDQFARQLTINDEDLRWLLNFKAKHSIRRKRAGKPTFADEAQPATRKHECIATQLPHSISKGVVRCCLCTAYHIRNCPCGDHSLVFYKSSKSETCRRRLECLCSTATMPSEKEIRSTRFTKPRHVYYGIRGKYSSCKLRLEIKRAQCEEDMDGFLASDSDSDDPPANMEMIPKPNEQPQETIDLLKQKAKRKRITPVLISEKQPQAQAGTRRDVYWFNV